MSFQDDLTDRFGELHTELGQAIEGLPAEALDWVPGPEMNSIAVLVVHLTGAERYWIGVALNEPAERDRDAEFRTKALSGDDLNAHVTAEEAYSRDALKRLSLAELEALRLSPRNAKSFTAGWCVVHALEHSALHLGHVQLTRQLWKQKGRS